MKKYFGLLLLTIITVIAACKKSDDEPTPPKPPVVEEVNSLDEKAVIAYSPAFPTDDKEITLVFNADKGNAGLKSFASDVYIWTGVITDKSTGPSDWKYVKSSDFSKPDANAKLTRVATDKYQLKFTPRSFFNVPAGEKILKVAMLFKNGDGSKSGRNADGSDIYLPISASGTLNIRFTSPEFNPFYEPSPVASIANMGESVKVTSVASAKGKITIYLNGTEVKSAENIASLTADVSLTKSGENEIKAVISSSGKTAEKKFNITVKGAVEVAALPAGAKPDGVTYLNNGTSAVFTLFAPNKQNVFVIGDLTDWKLDVKGFMKKTPDGKRWWIQIDGITPGEKYGYQFVVDGNLKVADPYCELILDPNNDQYIPASVFPGLKAYPTGKTTGIVSVAQSNEPTYSWKYANFTRPVKSKLVIYELHLRDFLQTHSYSTLRDTLSYLSTLGVNAIELMPVNEFEGNNSWGYNPSFYFSPDKYYGTKNMLKEVIDECHKRGIAVIIDMVLNHSFGQSPMVQLYWNGTTGKPASNSPWFNADATHPYNVGYDFNHESPDTKYFSKNVMKFWMEEYHLDGFRFDLSKGFTQKNNPNDVGAWSAYDATRIAIWKDYNNYMKSIDPNFYVILEHLGADQEEKELAAEGMLLWNNLNNNFAQATMGWMTDSQFSRTLYTNHGFASPNLVTYMESHDEERQLFKNKSYGNVSGSYNTKDLATALNRQQMATAFLFTVPGPNMIWQFGELGYDISIDQNGRTGEKPIHWEYAQDANRKKLHDVYSRMVKLKTKTNWLDNASVTTNSLGNTGIRYMVIESAAGKTVVVGNFDVTAQAININFPTSGAWYEYAGSGSGTINLPAGTYNTTLEAGEYHVYTSSVVNP
ncbi:alpha-amylase family glycosyl hydrolase [Solitalea sp. MAHUQ-68]|uniref:Alpha-amylase family glycosyl hydrolase n=1 Tax=Solitalea agri TaxID=2953739 RepID=A0A9X2FCK4_9SPHI|nr:alpha-amylase family glycosyl hydrolase [Solitalea agri]MCO4294388.1 alpha-amylase family glycosyl hydrolase [Solitalea agri]